MRNTLYRLARLLSDVSAIRRERLTRGISRRMARRRDLKQLVADLARALELPVTFQGPERLGHERRQTLPRRAAERRHTSRSGSATSCP
jgi:hypothetical protein